jgi:hypothetical protein
MKETIPSKRAEYAVEARERERGGLGAAELIECGGEELRVERHAAAPERAQSLRPVPPLSIVVTRTAHRTVRVQLRSRKLAKGFDRSTYSNGPPGGNRWSLRGFRFGALPRVASRVGPDACSARELSNFRV